MSETSIVNNQRDGADRTALDRVHSKAPMNDVMHKIAFEIATSNHLPADRKASEVDREAAEVDPVVAEAAMAADQPKNPSP